jgi:hypothetical protein
VRDFWKDRQYTKELQRSELGGVAKDFGIKMRPSNQREIEKTFKEGDILIQDKGNGITGIYDRNRNFMGIRDKDGTYRGAQLLSEEDRNKYGSFNLEQDHGIIDTETGNFVQVRADTSGGFITHTPINNNNRIGKVKNMNFIDILTNLQ